MTPEAPQKPAWRPDVVLMLMPVTARQAAGADGLSALIDSFLEPGALVRHPAQHDWGLGQVQSVDGHRVTVNFEEAGKMTIDTRRVTLVYVGPDPRD